MKKFKRRFRTCMAICLQSEGGFNVWFFTCIAIGLLLGCAGFHSHWLLGIATFIIGGLCGFTFGTAPYWMFGFRADLEFERKLAEINEAVENTRAIMSRCPNADLILGTLLQSVEAGVGEPEVEPAEILSGWDSWNSETDRSYTRLVRILRSLKQSLDPQWNESEEFRALDDRQRFQMLYQELSSRDAIPALAVNAGPHRTS